MLHIEILDDGRTYTYSDTFKIRQETGIIYDSAVDQVGVIHTYEETDIPLDKDEDEEVTDEEIGKAIGEIV